MANRVTDGVMSLLELSIPARCTGMTMRSDNTWRNNISQAQSRLDAAKATRDAYLAQVAELKSCIEEEYGAREETVSSMAIKERPMTSRTGD